MNAVITRHPTGTVNQGNNFSPTLMVLVASLLWSFGGVLIKQIPWNPLAISAVRSVVDGLWMFAFLAYLIRKNEAVQNSWSAAAGTALKRAFLSRSKVQWLGAVSSLINMIAMTWAFQVSHAANAAFLHYAGIILVAFLSSRILGQELTRYDWIAMAVAIPGIGLLFWDGFESSAVLGTMLGLASAVLLAVTQICLGLVAKEDTTGTAAMESMLLSTGMTVVVGLPFVFMSPLPHAVGGHAWWFFLLLLCLFPTGIPNILHGLAIEKVPVFQVLMLGLAQPVLVSVWPAIFLGEIPTPLAITGSIIIAAAVVFQAVNNMRVKERQQSVVPRYHRLPA